MLFIMTPNNRVIISVILIVFVCKEVNSENDLVRIVVNQCNNCASSSLQYFTIGPNVTANTIALAVPSSSYFFIIQVHHYLEAVQLSYLAELSIQSSVIGTNIGLNQLTHDKNNHTFYLFNNFTEPSEVLIALISYPKSAPMPGGCNMEFNTETAPYQAMKFDNELITVDVQSASVYKYACDVPANITLDFYQMFMVNNPSSVHDFNDAIQQMLTVPSIRKNGHKVIRPINSPILRRLFNNYRGFGVVYAVLATFGNESSAYVPAFTYGCNMGEGTKSCFDRDAVTEWITIESIASISLFLLLTSNTDYMVPFLNIGYYAINSVLTSSGYLYAPYIFITIGMVAILACILGGCSKWCDVDRVILRLYAAHILTAVIYFETATGDYIICQTVAYFWFLYAALLITMMVPVLDQVSSCVNIVFHLMLMLDAFFGNGILIYFNINAVRRASYSNFYLASLFAPKVSTFVTIATGLIMGVFVITKCICRHKRQATTVLVNESTHLLPE